MRSAFRVLATLAAALAVACGLGAAFAAAQTAPALPLVTVALNGSSIVVTGGLQSGAVDVRTTTTNEPDGSPFFIHLNPGVTPAQAFAVADSPASRDPNSVSQIGSIVFSADAPRGSTDVQTVLAPGQYVAFDASGRDPRKWPRTSFTVAGAAHPAVLPTPTATVHAIDFAFRGDSTLRSGALVRFQNDGYVVHMIVATRVKNARAARRLTRLLRAGKDRQAQKLVLGQAVFMNPASQGAVQQQSIAARPGVWVLLCFMNAQDGREHTVLGMERTIRITG